MNQSPPVVNRNELQPFDLATANRIWKIAFKGADNLFYFGSGPWSHSEDVGYFIDSEGNISAILKSGKTISTWEMFSEFLRDEIDRAEEKYPEFENFIFKLKSESQ